jgi:hypothetical protein
MPEQSLLERIHGTHHPVATRKAPAMLLLGAAVGALAAIFMGRSVGLAWAVPGLLVAAACAWGFFAQRTRTA